MDPQIRKIMTRYDTNGFYTEWNEEDMKRICSLCLHFDKLISGAYGPEMKD